MLPLAGLFSTMKSRRWLWGKSRRRLRGEEAHRVDPLWGRGVLRADLGSEGIKEECREKGEGSIKQMADSRARRLGALSPSSVQGCLDGRRKCQAWNLLLRAFSLICESFTTHLTQETPQNHANQEAQIFTFTFKMLMTWLTPPRV